MYDCILSINFTKVGMLLFSLLRQKVQMPLVILYGHHEPELRPAIFALKLTGSAHDNFYIQSQLANSFYFRISYGYLL